VHQTKYTPCYYLKMYRVSILMQIQAIWFKKKLNLQKIEVKLRSVLVHLWLHKWISGITEHNLSNDDKTFFVYRITANFHKIQTDGKWPFSIKYAQGFSFNRDLAFSKAIGEYLERTPFLYYRDRDVKFFSVHEAKAKSIPMLHPNCVSVFSTSQKEKMPQSRYTNDSKFAWSEAKEILVKHDGTLDERIVYVPSQVFHWSYERKREEFTEPILREIGTHGGAGYFKKEEAIVRALYEWVGRDSFFRFWYSEQVPQRISGESIVASSELKKNIVWLERQGYKVDLYYCKDQLWINSIFCILTCPTRLKFNRSFGGGCASNLEEACNEALEEALSVVCWAGNQINADRFYEKKDPLRWNDVNRFGYFQTNKGLRLLMSRLLQGEEVQYSDLAKNNFEKNNESLVSIVGSIQAQKRDTRIFYIEAQDLLLKKLQYVSVKVFVTNFVPMFHIMHHYPEKIIAEQNTFSKEETLVYPHPYP
jgi:thiazole/oxazole-forming peptide maturase SagD family component